MTPRLATVLSARDWEADLVGLARETATVRLVLRAYQPEDLEQRRDEIDVVVAGAETSWVTPAQLASWRRAGLRVVGIYPSGDRPARGLLEAGGVDEILSDDVDPAAILQVARFLQPRSPVAVDQAEPGRVVGVTGCRGAPGRTEIALALALKWSKTAPTALLDLDLDAPSLAVRLGLPPRPDITDAADSVRADGEIPEHAMQHFRDVSIVVGSHRPGEPRLRSALAEDVVEAAAGRFAVVVLDLGPFQPDDRLLKRSDHAVLVAEASATGLVRAARAAAEWSGPPPALVLNRITDRRPEDLVAAARRWTGLEPAALTREMPKVRERARAAKPPHRGLLRSLRELPVPQ